MGSNPFQKLLFGVVFLFALCLVAFGVEARIVRSHAALTAFAHAHACPSTHQFKLPCPGYVIDHIKPLACGGPDKPSNMQWQTIAEGKAKDKWERVGCAMKAAQYPDSAKSTETSITIHVIWLPSHKATNQLCSALMDQPPPDKGTIVGCYNPETHTIYVVEPDSFNDHFGLEILGHEFWHSLGATHP